MNPPFLPEKVFEIAAGRSADNPLRVLFSACLTGIPCGVEGKTYGDYPVAQRVITLPSVKVIPFCPEDFAVGTPRDMPDIVGGDGFDVLDGKARFMSDKGADWTEPIVRAAHRMLEVAREGEAELAILMDMSAACGSQVISDGCRMVDERKYRKGPGVCTALLVRHGIPVVSQRDFRSLDRLLALLDPAHVPNPEARDHHEHPWYKEYFGAHPKG